MNLVDYATLQPQSASIFISIACTIGTADIGLELAEGMPQNGLATAPGYPGFRL